MVGSPARRRQLAACVVLPSSAKQRAARSSLSCRAAALSSAASRPVASSYSSIASACVAPCGSSPLVKAVSACFHSRWPTRLRAVRRHSSGVLVAVIPRETADESKVCARPSARR